jgi:hypothetical protein
VLDIVHEMFYILSMTHRSAIDPVALDAFARERRRGERNANKAQHRAAEMTTNRNKC